MSKICANCHQPLDKCECEHTTAIEGEQAEQDELWLTPEEISVYKLYGTEGFAGYDIDGLLKAQLAKLKAMGYKSPEEINKAIRKCVDSGVAIERDAALFVLNGVKSQLKGYVKWDREKVATGISVMICAKCGKVGKYCDECPLPKNRFEYEIADQLKEILTGSE